MNQLVNMQVLTMSSIDLRDIVNDARAESGEPRVRNDQFVARIKDEIGDDLGVCKKIAHPGTGAGLKGFRQVAKLLGIKENLFRAFLVEHKIQYQIGGEWVPYANHIDAGRFEVKTGASDGGHAFNQAKFTAKGITYVADLLRDSKREPEKALEVSA